MDDIDQMKTENEINHRSIIFRYWCDSHGKLRGQLIYPITNRAFAIESVVELHQVLDQAIDKISNLKDENNTGSI